MPFDFFPRIVQFFGFSNSSTTTSPAPARRAPTPSPTSTHAKKRRFSASEAQREPGNTGNKNEPRWKRRDESQRKSSSSSSSSSSRRVAEYACRDVEVREAWWQMVGLMHGFAEEYFGFGVVPNNKPCTAFFERFEPETAKIIGCVASGGPGGEAAWRALFVDEKKRKGLVMAMVGNMLVEHVFKHMFFGGLPEQVKAMSDLQRTYKDHDGFHRNKEYAAMALQCTHGQRVPPNFTNHVNCIVGAIHTHLEPILALDPVAPAREHVIGAIHTMVTHAGLLSLAMRLDPHTVYHLEPVFKEDRFSSKRMECINQREMEQTNPHTADDTKGLSKQEKRRRATLSDGERKRAKHDEPLTQMTILHGVTAYRLGGWEASNSRIQEVKYEKEEHANQGLRVRKLTKGLVYCRWGRRRRFQEGKSEDMAEVDGEAGKGGFVEFSEVKGVVDWRFHVG
ncbi:hypothetical protein ACEQ8H_008375 [Pleosporales sp. CAS-2024a]